MKAINLFCLRPEADWWLLPHQTPEVAPPLNNKKTWSDERNINFRQGCGSESADLGFCLLLVLSFSNIEVYRTVHFRGPDPRQRQNSEALQAQNGAVEGLKTIGHRNTLMKSRISITIHIQVKSLIRIHNPDFRYLNTY